MTNVSSSGNELTPDEILDTVLASAHQGIGTAVHCRLSGRDGPPELRDPDLALTRVLASAFRQVGLATVARLQPEPATENAAPRKTHTTSSAQDDGLLSHLPATRLKYRYAALEAVRAIGPRELLRVAGDAVSCAQQLSFLLSEGERCAEVQDSIQKLRRYLKEILRLPTPSRKSTPLAGQDYLGSVTEQLARRTDRITAAARSIRRLMEPELLSCIEQTDEELIPQAMLGAAEVAQDISDDLARILAETEQLIRITNVVEQASNDFCGADLRDASLHGIPLDGVLWDLGTEWPPEWECHIRDSSVPAGDNYGVLVIEHSSVIRSDA